MFRVRLKMRTETGASSPRRVSKRARAANDDHIDLSRQPSPSAASLISSALAPPAMSHLFQNQGYPNQGQGYSSSAYPGAQQPDLAFFGSSPSGGASTSYGGYGGAGEGVSGSMGSMGGAGVSGGMGRLAGEGRWWEAFGTSGFEGEPPLLEGASLACFPPHATEPGAAWELAWWPCTTTRRRDRSTDEILLVFPLGQSWASTPHTSSPSRSPSSTPSRSRTSASWTMQTSQVRSSSASASEWFSFL